MVEDKNLRKELNKLRKDLKGKYSEVASELGLSVATISRVLNGDFQNDDVIRACVAKRKQIIADKNKMFA